MLLGLHETNSKSGADNKIVSSWAFAKVLENTSGIPELWGLEPWGLEGLADSVLTGHRLARQANMLFSFLRCHSNSWKVCCCSY